MQNVFQFLVTILFGKRWHLFDLKQGYKATLFINELEIDMLMSQRKEQEQTKTDVLNEITALSELPELTNEDVKNALPEDLKESEEEQYKKRKELMGVRVEQIAHLKSELETLDQKLNKLDGEIAKGNSIAYNNRLKYDYLKNYKVKKSYGDK